MPKLNRTSKPLPWEWKPKKKSWSANDEKRYFTPQWRKLTAYMKAKQRFCVECKKLGIATISNVTDHIQAVNRGGDFWDESNLQRLCTSCHNKKKT